ncbi:MAG: hypothetical protein GKR77_00845 [Legionellales bacterium]|nr:hypothetical protein [Legionellales bacterium]
MPIQLARILIILLGLGGFFLSNAQTASCNGPYRNQTLTQTQVDALLAQQQPINLCGANVSGLDFSHADLTGANFAGADLSYANFHRAQLSNAHLEQVYFRWANLVEANLTHSQLTHAILADANLDQANLSQARLQHANLSRTQLHQANLLGALLMNANLMSANLTQATLSWANLTDAKLAEANLTDANLANANLTDTDLSRTNLTRANLQNSQLIRANLDRAQLTDADLTQADLAYARYQPELNTMPNVITLATAKHLDTIQFDSDWGIPALTELRSAYMDNGMRQMERQVTALVKTSQMKSAWQRGGYGYVEAIFSYILFYLPSHYGADPGRPLRIFLIAMILFTLPYWFALQLGNRRHAIWVIWQTPYHHHQVLAGRQIHRQHHHKWKRHLHLWRVACYFSLITSFQIGWQDFNISNWITRLQHKDYRLQATGWVRFIAGSQALLSAYLIVLWAFTYFGRPFNW